MSLERLKKELDDAHENRKDTKRTLVHIRLALYEIAEYLENQSSCKKVNDSK